MTAWPSFLSLPTQGRDLLRHFRSQISGPYPRITSPPGVLPYGPYDMFSDNPGVCDATVLSSYIANPLHGSAPYISVDPKQQIVHRRGVWGTQAGQNS